MNIYLQICAVLVLIGLAVAPASAWEADEYPIGFWYGPPPEANTLDTWRIAKEANFTFCGPRGGYSVEDNPKMLGFCQQVGLKAMVTDGRISWEMTAGDDWQKTVAEVVADYGAHPALFGYYLQDEPNYRLFAPLGEVSAEFLKQDPKHLPYVNLFPTYASVEQLGTPTYWDHLDCFLRLTKPAVLSYDHYCLMKDGSTRPDYFENLALIREAGLRYDTPPWNIILSLPHFGYRDPTDAEMRWQVYTSLAYGMKGILYFTYWTALEWEAQNEIAIVDSKGKPGRLYPIVQQLNAEMRTLGKTLLRLRSTGVFHTGEVPQGCARLGGDAIVQVPQDLPLLVGFFRDADGADYAMIVNRDFGAATEFEASFLPHVTAVHQLSATGGEEEVLPLVDHKLKLTLAAGDGRLLRLATDFDYPEPPKTLADLNFQFDGAGDLEGWEGFNSLTDPNVGAGHLTATFAGPDPFLSRSFLRVPADRYTKVRVRMKLASGSGTAQFFWATGPEPSFADDKYLNFPVACDGEYHEYDLPVGRHSKWRGQTIRAIRLDPVTGGAERGSKVELDWVIGE